MTHIMLKSNGTDNMRIKRTLKLLFFLMIFVLLCIIWNDCKHSQFPEKLISQSDKIQHEFSTVLEILRKKNTLEIDKITNPKELPIIYCITPTYYRPVQKAELTRLSHIVRLVPNIHWIIVEDNSQRSQLISNFLSDSFLLRYTHLFAETPSPYKFKAAPDWHLPRGVAQRNEGLKWIRNNLSSDTDRGIVYFMDDDNTYTTELFAEMIKIKHVGVWPVGLVGGLMVEKPIVDFSTGKVMGFNSAWEAKRPFPVDMASFAINLKVILSKPDAFFSYKSKLGYQESDFLMQFTKRNELEPLASNCTKVLVWHTRSEKPRLKNEEELNKRGIHSDKDIEV